MLRDKGFALLLFGILIAIEGVVNSWFWLAGAFVGGVGLALVMGDNGKGGNDKGDGDDKEQ